MIKKNLTIFDNNSEYEAFYGNESKGYISPNVSYIKDSGKTRYESINYITGITLDKYIVKTKQGDTEQITATIHPSSATTPNIVWKSSNRNVVSVTRDGQITAHALSGNCKIYAVAADGSGVSAKCDVIVENIHVSSITLSDTERIIYSGDTFALTATVLPEDAPNKKVIWSSSNNSIATVTQNGVVSGVSAGNCNIIAVSDDVESVSATCEVKVKQSFLSDYFTIVANSDATIKFTKPTLSYSVNGGAWNTMSSSGTVATLQTGDVLTLKSTAAPTSADGIGCFSASTGSFFIRGNFMSLVYGDDFAIADSFGSYISVFRSLFEKCTGLTDASESVLPVEDTVQYSYHTMFSGCKNLVAGPEIHAKHGSNRCFYGMFKGCTSLEYPPHIKTEDLGSEQYTYTFENCTSLKEIPELPNLETVPYNAFNGMFAGCTSLEAVPTDLFSNSVTVEYGAFTNLFNGCTNLKIIPACLPATTIGSSAYASMFAGCISLKKTPIISATTFSDGSNQMSGMFSGCTGITEANKLLPTTLAKECYSSMFYGCTSLVSVPEDMLPATTFPTTGGASTYFGIYANMFFGCTKLEKAPTLPATNTTASSSYYDKPYYKMFYNCSSLNYVKCLATNISGGATDWLSGVNATGTFVTTASATWATGASGIPNGWTRQNI